MPAELSAELNTCFTADIPHPVMVLFRVTRLFVPDLLVISTLWPGSSFLIVSGDCFSRLILPMFRGSVLPVDLSFIWKSVI